MLSLYHYTAVILIFQMQNILCFPGLGQDFAMQGSNSRPWKAVHQRKR